MTAPLDELYRTLDREHEESSDLDRTGDVIGVDRQDETGPIRPGPRSVWSFRQIERTGLQVALVLILFSSIGLAFRSSGPQYVARTEFVYTLDESVPDSFLREDRRLLTQIATLQSDAVVVPVADSFAVPVDDLRNAMIVETVDLSEVVRLHLRDADPDRARALSEAVMAQYVLVISQPPPSEESDAIERRRSEIIDSLAEADSALIALERNRSSKPALATAQESVERQVAYRNDQINRLQALIDDSLVRPISSLRRANLNDELARAQEALDALEAELSVLRTTMTEAEAKTAAELALLRDIDRLEADLETIDEELAQRELGPLIASPIQVLGEPIVATSKITQWRGPAIGLMAAIPFAALLAYRSRQRQLWLGA